MDNEFNELRLAISRVFPTSRFTPLNESALAAIRDQYPDAPSHYLAFLREVGAGRLGESSFMIYDGLCKPSDFFDQDMANLLNGILFFGDDFSGCMVGFNTRLDWQIVSVDSHTLEPMLEEARTLNEFISRRVEIMKS